MPLQFNPPEWLIQEYMNRKTPLQEISEAGLAALNTLAQRKQLDADRQLKTAAAKREQDTLNLAKAKDAREASAQGMTRFTDTGDPTGLPADLRGMVTPAQGPLLPDQDRSDLLGSYDSNDPGKVVTAEWIRGFREKYPQGIKGREKEKADPSSPVPLYDPNGQQIGTVPGNSKFLSPAAGVPKPPAGYRYRPDGNLEAIPGGPAAEKKTGANEKVEQTFALYETARDGLLTGLEGSVTGPVAGRLPAFTAAQQTAEGGVSAMAPVLKQLFRVAGEGVFTDRDQEILLKMVPTRADHPEARRKKIENIDNIVKAKLGMKRAGVPSAAPAPTATPPAAGNSDPLGIR